MSMDKPTSVNPQSRVEASFKKQGLMAHLGAKLSRVEPGQCEIELPYREELLQQHGFFHGGGIAAIIDTAGGYAALSLFEPGDGVLTVEFKINCLSPALGEKLIAKGEEVKSGQTLAITKGEVIAVDKNKEVLCALMQQTIMRMPGKDKLKG